MNFPKNRHLLFGVVILALVSMSLCVALFVSERRNEYQIQNISRRLEQTSTTQQAFLEIKIGDRPHFHRQPGRVGKRLFVCHQFFNEEGGQEKDFAHPT